MLAEPQGRIALWDLHMHRLADSAHSLGYARPDTQQLRRVTCEAINQALTDAPPSTATSDGWRVRLLVDEAANPSVTVTPQPALTRTPKVILSPTRLDSSEPWLRHKTTHRPWYTQAAQWLHSHPDYFDVLYCNERDELCEGSRSNVYLKINDQWLTPPLSSGLLPGVWRSQLVAQGRVRESVLPRSWLTVETEVRLSNGLRGWFDVRPDLTVQGP